MLTLFIDSSNGLVLYLIENEKVINFLSEKNLQTSERIISLIISIMGNRQPKNIVIINGPGNFTGISVGISTALGMRFSANCKLISTNNLEILSFFSKKQEICVLYETNEHFYIQKFENFIAKKIQKIDRSAMSEVFSKSSNFIGNIQNLDFDNYQFEEINELKITELVNFKVKNSMFLEKIELNLPDFD